jgi:hypothetical protein
LGFIPILRLCDGLLVFIWFLQAFSSARFISSQPRSDFSHRISTAVSVSRSVHVGAETSPVSFSHVPLVLFFHRSVLLLVPLRSSSWFGFGLPARAEAVPKEPVFFLRAAESSWSGPVRRQIAPRPCFFVDFGSLVHISSSELISFLR